MKLFVVNQVNQFLMRPCGVQGYSSKPFKLTFCYNLHVSNFETIVKYKMKYNFIMIKLRGILKVKLNILFIYLPFTKRPKNAAAANFTLISVSATSWVSSTNP